MIGPDHPIYPRLRDATAAAISKGQIRGHGPLPSVRIFAVRHGINPLTVSGAYEGFQNDGIAITRRGLGIFVSEGATARLRVSEKYLPLDTYRPEIKLHIHQLCIDPANLPERAH